MKICAVLGLLGLLVLGCGVKGDPLPPETPAPIGRGYPTYHKAVERFEIRTEPTEDEEESKKKNPRGE
jgi:hypothetical protein